LQKTQVLGEGDAIFLRVTEFFFFASSDFSHNMGKNTGGDAMTQFLRIPGVCFVCIIGWAKSKKRGKTRAGGVICKIASFRHPSRFFP